MQELCLAIALVASAIGGLEYVATVAMSWTAQLAQSDDLEDMLELDLDDSPHIEFDMDFSATPEGDKPRPSPATGERP